VLIKLLYYILNKLSAWTLIRYRPIIVAVSGSLGKTSTKNAIGLVLKKSFPTRTSFQSYNNQIGVPLTILGFKTPGRSIIGWAKIFLLGFLRIIYQSSYPRILVLEMGADRKGDINYLTSLARPNIAVLTNIGNSHLQYFLSKKALIKEKESLIKALPKDGTAVLNFDNPTSRKIGLKSRREVLFYGLKKGAGFRAFDLKFRPQGMSFKVEAAGNLLPVQISALGRSQVYNSLAALAVGSLFKLDLVEMANLLKEFRGEKGRQQYLAGRKNSKIIDDSYNSAPESAKMALETLDRLAGKGRRVVIFGDMLELGRESLPAHQEIGQEAAKVADLMIFVGQNAKTMARAARKERPEKLVSWFKNYQAANKKILPLIKKNDIILIKGSQKIRLEKVVAKLLSPELDPEKILVRQDREWQGKE